MQFSYYFRKTKSVNFSGILTEYNKSYKMQKNLFIDVIKAIE